ncbi:SMI1/KNR4 family protein [Nocardioides sp. S5]|uniref:SMI1/KNR4 family protein n=1 Tax=Nocardioides sp. S5 TaxID=2017486 RepID=UPI001A8ECEC3|nr:SMI1/KNR4 family protein [Nocardioides sp. S5]QSR30807.1 SMI1/KNR4 family protein [Nocardioides sp. S5]
MPTEPEAVADLLRSQGRMAFVEPTTETTIDAFEAEHGIRLPSQLKQWLLVSDGGDFFLPAGFQLRGLAHQPLIDVDDPDRPDDNYIVIGALSSGDPVLFERSSDRISIYNREAGRIEANESFDDFFTFLTDLAAVVGIGDDDVE